MRPTILDTDHTRVRRFFLEDKAYTTLDLPKYFTFQTMLSQLSVVLNGTFLGITAISAAKRLDTVNHVLYGNKDGKYDWRKYELINPLLYVSLVNAVTEESNWCTITSRFDELRVTRSIQCMSIPVLPDRGASQKATQVSEWLETIEKASLRYALDFEHIYQTDITDCYGSIYTHSISWALHDKITAKANRRYDALLGNLIDHHLQAMSNGQTNGIPQGSLLMNFIAEMLLAYADRELYQKINSKVPDDAYLILRYRDDYRIFVREPSHGDLIMKALSEVMIDLGLRLNTSKTKRSDDVILSSIKPAKIVMLDKKIPSKLSQAAMKVELLQIYELGRSYPNAGTIKTRLTKLYGIAKERHYKNQKYELLSILVNIAFDSPDCFPMVAAFISSIVGTLNIEAKKTAMERIWRKLSLLPNSGLVEIWLQRVMLSNSSDHDFKEDICRKVTDNEVALYQCGWIADQSIRDIIVNAELIDTKILRTMDPVISSEEIQLFAIEDY
ncbi:RNA-directed DNA polymerase [Acidithrix sp. C25]|uniref:RNA-directed DNA polymerase n=1 Tax=Acidithrix sp. C25 TaxID=1671482 RepID=UPI001BB865CA|nr:RNA-directed DNA polymerase [Acidithrix sp. C25]CAG4927387.1 unnamed protein product [Acidithrix sp. C25]